MLHRSAAADWAQVSALGAANLQVTAPAGGNLIYADTAAAVAALTLVQRAELLAVGVTEIALWHDLRYDSAKGQHLRDLRHRQQRPFGREPAWRRQTAFHVVDLGGFDGADTFDMLLRESRTVRSASTTSPTMPSPAA